MNPVLQCPAPAAHKHHFWKRPRRDIADILFDTGKLDERPSVRYETFECFGNNDGR